MFPAFARFLDFARDDMAIAGAMDNMFTMCDVISTQR
jgi:hypothetical protein